MSLFEMTLFILERDNDDKKNNRLYLNGSKGTIDAPLLNICLCFFLGQPPLSPEEGVSFSCILMGFIGGCNSGPLFINQGDSTTLSAVFPVHDRIYQNVQYIVVLCNISAVCFTAHILGLFAIALKGELDIPQCCCSSPALTRFRFFFCKTLLSAIDKPLVFESKSSRASQ